MTDFATPLIFVSYRNSDSAGETGRMVDHLKTVIDKQYFFLDVDNLSKGDIFPPLLKKSIEQCEVFIAVIGPGWIDRLNMNVENDATDYVRMELAMALNKKKRILPVLVKDAKMPLAIQLPKDLKGFDQYNATDLSYSRWEFDMTRIVDALKRYGIPIKEETKRNEKKNFAWSVAIVAIVLLLFIGLKEFVFEDKTAKSDIPSSTREVTALVAGTWKPMVTTKTNTTYKISQTSKQVTIEEFDAGMRTRIGSGLLTGNKLSFYLPDQAKGNRSYTLELSDDRTKLIGIQSLNVKVGKQNIGTAVTWEKMQQ